MSYILDALKKSEQERRQHKTAPDLSTIHQAAESDASASPLRYFIWLVLIATVGGAGWWGYSQLNRADMPKAQASMTQPQPAPKATATPKTAAAPVADRQAQALYQRDSAPQAQQVNQLYQTETKAPSPAAPIPPKENKNLPNIRDLPLSLQSQIAPMDYSAHVYSSDVSRGFAIINGKRRYREDQMENGLTVVTVLEEAVVMEYMGQLFMLDAMQSWPE